MPHLHSAPYRDPARHGWQMAPCQLPAMSDQAEQRPSLPAGLAGRFRRWLTRCPAYLVARWLTRRDRLVGFARCKAVKADALYRPCLSSTCTGGHIHRKKTNPVVKCKICGSLSCYDPHMPWHAGYSCDSVRFFFDRVSPAAICFFIIFFHKPNHCVHPRGG